MKRYITLFLVILSSMFLITGCSNDNLSSDGKTPVNLKEVVGKVVNAKVNSDGKIVIDKSKITDKVTYINYDVDGIIVGLLAVKDSKGDMKVVVDTCQSCGGSPYAYFVQVGDKIQCQNCGNMFSIDELDNLVDDGCNPIVIEDKTETDNEILIGTEQLKKLKEKFENWKGPTKEN